MNMMDLLWILNKSVLMSKQVAAQKYHFNPLSA
jgi:hypothetical protein